MAKYSYELKKKIVEEDLNGNAGHKILAKKYQIGESQIRRWSYRIKKNTSSLFEGKMFCLILFLLKNLSERR